MLVEHSPLVFPHREGPVASPIKPLHVLRHLFLLTHHLNEPYPSTIMPSHQDQQRQCARALVPLLAWLWGIAAALSLRYGYYADRQLVLGPNTSRMMQTSSLLVEQLQVKGKAKQGVLLYGFNEKPELSFEANWTISNNFFVDTYNRQGFSMWLNKGSRIWMEWQVAHGGEGYASDMLVVLIKGEQNMEELQRYCTSSHIDLGISRDGRKGEYIIAEDNMYYLGVVNLTPRSIVMNINIKVTSKMYDTSKATSICSTSNVVCKLKLLFPNTQYYVLATPESEVPLQVWNIQISFVARLTAYLFITVFVVVIVSMMLKHLGACHSEEARQEHVIPEAQTETDPILSVKEMPCTYGTIEEEPQSSICCSSEDLYDGKICVICYDGKRNSFFTPCGHCATCYSCAESSSILVPVTWAFIFVPVRPRRHTPALLAAQPAILEAPVVHTRLRAPHLALGLAECCRNQLDQTQ
ncbi:hypothetical protein Cni_G06207 [Canna indica]|uniref:Uncharacterized protein n=1 Tax=Canna indica TaxID=4628 RepID=A0AAQ3JY89_9LILI|nr:hypothetical protein Cni_G06207 [Canna indica]